ncbi:MAG: ABC transporter permease [Ignavibacteria bacterium]
MKIIKSGFKSAWTHKLRAFFMILGIMIGIAALTVIISLGKGTEEKVMSQVKKLFSSNTIIVVAGAGEMEGNEKNSLPPVNLKISDMEEIADNIENIIEWDAVQIAPEKVAKYKGRNTIVTASGQTATAEEVWNIVLTDGRFFTESENKSLARVALIAPNVQKELFGDSDPIGNQIKIDNIPFQVIGTIAPRGMDPHGIDKDSEIIVPLNTLLRRVVNLDYLMLGKLLVADESIINSTAEQVTQKLRETHNISDNENDDFMAITPEAVKEMIKEANKMFNLYLPIVAVVSLLVGSIVVANLMLISVNERIKEIGLRKAVGAKSKDILTQFLIETSSITLFSGFTGVLVGMIILTQITKMMDLPFTVSWVTLTACFVISTFIGVVSGIVPAMRASRLEPVTSLK